MEQGKREARVRGKHQLISFLQGEEAAVISFSEPALTQRDAGHSGHRLREVTSSALMKAAIRNRAGLSFSQELQLCQKSQG